jgi:hypothetical protein
MAEYRTLADLAEAVVEHFSKTDMPEFVRCEKVGDSYGLSAGVSVPYAVAEPSGYCGDDELYYWESSSLVPFRDPLVLADEGFTLRSMAANESPSRGFVESYLEDSLDVDSPVTLGCVIVTFDGDESPEWAWASSN